MKDGRIPEGITHRIGFWKAEDYQKFTFPVSEMVLGGVLPDNHYHVWVLIVRIVELVFSCGRNGWTQDSLKLLKNLIWRHNILTEEAEGLHSCVISMHNLVHMPDDIFRFSSPDNYWCFSFERAVHGYVERSTNNKNLELTFFKAETRRELLKFLFETNTATSCSSSPSESAVSAMDSSLDKSFVHHANSIEQAKQRYGNLNIAQAVLVGGKKHLLLQSNLIPTLQFNVNEIVGTACRSIVFLNNMHGKMVKQYRTGEHVLIATESSCDVVRITDLFMIRHLGEEHLFVKGEKYISPSGSPRHVYSSHHIVHPTSITSIYPIESLLRKLILYPDPDNLDFPSCYVVIDFERPQVPLEQNDIIIPAYPLAGDMVLVQGDNDDLWHAHIISVNYRSRHCQVAFYVEDDSCPGRYKKETVRCSRSVTESIHWDSIVRQSCGSWEGVFWKEE